jgi:hypothetical protein
MADPILPVPNDDKKVPPAQQKTNTGSNEASAADLLSLWGSGSSTTPKPVAPKPIVAPAVPKPIVPAAPKPVTPVVPVAPKPVAPAPTLAPTPPVHVPPKPLAPSAVPTTPLPKVEPKKTAGTPAPLFTAMPRPPTPAPAALPPIPPQKPITPPPLPPTNVPKPKEQKPAGQVSWGDIVSPKPQPVPPPPKVAQPPKPEKSEPVPQKPMSAPEKKKEEIKEPPKKEKPEVIEGELVSSAKSNPEKAEEKTEKTDMEFLEDEDSFAVKLEEFLHEFNLKPAHIFYAIGGIIAVIILIFGGIWGFKYFMNRNSNVTIPVKERPATVILREETGVPSTADVGETIRFTAGMVGLSGVFSTIPIGIEMESRTPLVSYLILFRRVNNAYSTNVSELLNKSTDRKARLRGYLSLLRSLDAESTKAVENIKKETATIQTQYDPYKKRQEEVDKNFFQQLEAFNGQTAEDLLYDFINVSKEMISLQSRFKALVKIQSFFETALPKVERRINDIELNEDALVSGIKVYDVQGSDLDLILSVEGQTKAADQLNYSAVPFLSVSPFQLTGGKDFITQPGGGFANKGTETK